MIVRATLIYIALHHSAPSRVARHHLVRHQMVPRRHHLAAVAPRWCRRAATAPFGAVVFSLLRISTTLTLAHALACQARGHAVCRHLTLTPFAPLSAAPTVMADENLEHVDLCKINALVTLRSRKAVYRPIRAMRVRDFVCGQRAESVRRRRRRRRRKRNLPEEETASSS